jgi:hypothetical protein
MDISVEILGVRAIQQTMEMPSGANKESGNLGGGKRKPRSLERGLKAID